MNDKTFTPREWDILFLALSETGDRWLLDRLDPEGNFCPDPTNKLGTLNRVRDKLFNIEQEERG